MTLETSGPPENETRWSEFPEEYDVRLRPSTKIPGFSGSVVYRRKTARELRAETEPLPVHPPVKRKIDAGLEEARKRQRLGHRSSQHLHLAQRWFEDYFAHRGYQLQNGRLMAHNEFLDALPVGFWSSEDPENFPRTEIKNAVIDADHARSYQPSTSAAKRSIDVEEFPSNDSDFLKSMAAELKGSSSADATRVNGIAALLRSQSIADNRRRSIGSIEKTLLKHYAKLVEAAKRSQRTCEEVEKNCLAGSASPQIADDLRKVADVLGSRASRLRKRLNSLFGRNAIAETG